MMMVLVRTAVGFSELDAMFFHLVDGSKVDSIGADHFHMFTNLAQVRHARSPDIVSAERSGCPRSDARSVGKECVSTCRSRWSSVTEKKKKDSSKLQH